MALRQPLVSDERFQALAEAGKSDNLSRDHALLATLEDISKALLKRTKVSPPEFDFARCQSRSLSVC
jgi:hypothetical protein